MGDVQALGVEERGELLEPIGWPAAGRAERQGVRGQEVGGVKEIIVGLFGVYGVGGRIAELGQARQRLAKPSSVLVRQHLDAAPHVVQLVEQDVMARWAVPAERLTLGRLEEDIERTGSLQERLEVGGDQRAG